MFSNRIFDVLISYIHVHITIQAIKNMTYITYALADSGGAEGTFAPPEKPKKSQINIKK